MTEEQFTLLLDLIQAAIANHEGSPETAIHYYNVCERFRAAFVAS